MSISQEQIKLMKILMPYSTERLLDRAQKIQSQDSKDNRFVHYTSATAAASIIQNKSVWMRKSSLMNDFMEIEHGRECLLAAYQSDIGESFKENIEAIFPNLTSEIEELYDGWTPEFQTGTFLTCFSEHLDAEDEHGRLSMWRAYGASNGIAFVLKPDPFLSESNALGAYSSPVAYLDREEFKNEFKKIVSNIRSESEFLKEIGRESVKNSLFHMFRFSVLCTKHPGFEEEREWRVIYQPALEKSEHIASEVLSLDGVPQTICKIPLIEIPEHNFTGASIEKIVDRIIVGPSYSSYEIARTLTDLLLESGVKNAGERVIVSGIPLRTP